MPPGVQILSISCSFWDILAKLYVGAPPPGSWRPLLEEILDPPLYWHNFCRKLHENDKRIALRNPPLVKIGMLFHLLSEFPYFSRNSFLFLDSLTGGYEIDKNLLIILS